jgi:hypothetical protein
MNPIKINLSTGKEDQSVNLQPEKRKFPQDWEKTDRSSQTVFSKITKREEASPKSNISLELKIQFKEVKKNYPLLFACKDMEETDQSFSPMPDVDMSKKFVVSTTEFSQIGTTGVCDCLAYCMRGQTSQRETFLGIAHSPGEDPETVIQSLSNEFLEKGCLKDTLSIYVIGGVLPHIHNEYGSVEDEIQVLSLSKKYPIRGVCFNKGLGEEIPLSIVLSADGLYFSKNPIFSSLQGYENAGVWI